MTTTTIPLPGMPQVMTEVGTPSVTWACSCGTRTWSRCRDCDEATCGDCLATHRCEEDR